MPDMVQIRPEEPRDQPSVHSLTERAFARIVEADLNDRLRANGKASLSLVAVDGETIVGHVMFSPVEFAPARGVALGPIAVLPERQGQGIGRRLVEEGIGRAREAGWEFVMLLGAPEFYLRFGFAPGVDFGMRCDYDVPDENFMVVELVHGALGGVKGTARFAPEFREAA